MRVCDKHISERAYVFVALSDTDERFDLCAKCLEQVRAFLVGDVKTLEPAKPKGIIDRIKDSVKTG